MLMAISLAEKLGSRGLTAFSLHPGTVKTQLSAHIDFSVEWPEMGRHFAFAFIVYLYCTNDVA